MIGNRLYILTHNGLYQRVEQKLPKSIRCISELENMIINIVKNLENQNIIS